MSTFSVEDSSVYETALFLFSSSLNAFYGLHCIERPLVRLLSIHSMDVSTKHILTH